MLILWITKSLQETNHLPLLIATSNQGANPSKKGFKMKGVYWNSNGFRDPKKHKFVSDLMKENNLNFITISETCWSDFTPRFLKNLCSGRDYLWHCKPLNGRSGGTFLGVDLQCIGIGSIDEGDHYIKFHLTNKTDEFKWALVLLYGPAQDDRK
jgi:hypothetical protein